MFSINCAVFKILISIFLLSLFVSCKPQLTLQTKPNIPAKPQVVLRNGDTLFGNDASVVKNRLSKPIAMLDGITFSFDSVKYVHTLESSTFYFLPPKRITEQIFYGKLNGFGTSSTLKQQDLSNGKTPLVHLDRIAFLQKWPDEKLAKFSLKSLEKMVSDYAPAEKEAKLAKSIKTRAIAVSTIGGILALTSAILLESLLLENQYPQNEKYQPFALVGLGLGGFALVYGIPISLTNSKYHRDKAIQLYNEQ
ncbi:MAG: hypothetical protein ABI378_09240 [Chitinophagaceae bacterium]